MKVIILAGGESRRMGELNKSFLPFKEGRSILEEMLLKIRPLDQSPLLVVKDPTEYQQYQQNLKIVTDIYEAGPLGGLHAGLYYSPADYNLLLGCDMPFIKVEFLKYLKKKVTKDILIPQTYKGIEPLHAVYHKNCLPAIERAIKNNCCKLSSFFEEVDVEFLSEKDIRSFDSQLQSFININTQKDYLNALAKRCNNKW